MSARVKPAPDTAEIRRALELMFGPDDIVELRCFPRGRGKRTDAGYFDGKHRGELLKHAERLNRAGANIYVAMNLIDPQLLGRYANRIEEWAQATTSDHNILRRNWLFLDFDPKRPKDTAASDEQLEMAKVQAFQCAEALSAAGWPEPLTVMSGNGVHLLYRIDLPNDDASRDLINATLEALAKRFDSMSVGLDRTCYNAARIVKLPGTVSTKGDNTPALPWRMSHFLSVPDTSGTVTEDQLRNLLPPPSPPGAPPTAPRHPGAKSFDLETFLSRLGIEYNKDVHGGRERYKLRCCPFNEDHGKGEAAVFRSANGKLGFKCQHNGCADKHWEDVRALLDGQREQGTRVAPSHSRPVFEPDDGAEVTISDFYAYMPQHRYIFRPNGELWPAESVDNRLPPQKLAGRKKPMKASLWLDRFEPVEQMTWAPCEPELILDWLIDQGGWITRTGCRVFNLYRPPASLPGDPKQAGRWRMHLERIYPNEQKHIEQWLAHRVQRPGEKLNHCLVLQGGQGVGKDTLLEPVKRAIGPWNWNEISPSQMLGNFNAWARAVVVRISEARDLGEFNRYAFYDHSKVYMAAPPDVLRINAKFMNEHYIPNVMGVIITTNNATDGIYLDPDDRRHFVAGSEATKEDFDADYWKDIWSWYTTGGIGHVAAYLGVLDLADFDAKAPPPKTQAFWRIVHSNAAPEDAGLADVLEALDRPKVVTLRELADAANNRGMSELAEFLTGLKTRRLVQHRLKAAGYEVLHNQDSKDGLWKLGTRRLAVYAARGLSYREAVEALKRRGIGQ